MMSARTATLTVSILLMSACSKLQGLSGATSQSSSQSTPHVAGGGGSAWSGPGDNAPRLAPYKCDDIEREMSMCGEPMHASHFQTPAWLRDRPNSDVPRPRRIR